MDPRNNPYAPGAGESPPELAGRSEIVGRADIALHRIRNNLSSRSLILYGLRGVGKTVLLNKIRLDAEASGIFAAQIEAPEKRSLPAILVPTLRSMLLKLNRSEQVKEHVAKAMRALGGFAKALKIRYNDIEFNLDIGSESGIADSGDLEVDLGDLLVVIGEAAKVQNTVALLCIDELQYVPEDQLSALISALHRSRQNQLPITLIAAGLPQLLGQMGNAKSYAERLFEFVSIDRLNDQDAKAALCKPAEKNGVSYSDSAVQEILTQTRGYPYFIQEWGKHGWNAATNSPISLEDVKIATPSALADLDNGFFRVRSSRMTPMEKRYIKAMAHLGPGPHRSSDIATHLGRTVSQVSSVRESLILKGMIYSPTHGDTAFTVPPFDEYIKRTMTEL